MGFEYLSERSGMLINDSRTKCCREGRQSVSGAVANDRPFLAVAADLHRAGDYRYRFLGRFELERESAVLRFDILEQAAKNDFPFVQHSDVVRDALDLLQQMRRKEHGASFVADSANDGLEDVAAHQ